MEKAKFEYLEHNYKDSPYCEHNRYEYRTNKYNNQERYCLDCHHWFGADWWCSCLEGKAHDNPYCGNR
jgi:hypothetical protein